MLPESYTFLFPHRFLFSSQLSLTLDSVHQRLAVSRYILQAEHIGIQVAPSSIYIEKYLVRFLALLLTAMIFFGGRFSTLT